MCAQWQRKSHSLKTFTSDVWSNKLLNIWNCEIQGFYCTRQRKPAASYRGNFCRLFHETRFVTFLQNDAVTIFMLIQYSRAVICIFCILEIYMYDLFLWYHKGWAVDTVCMPVHNNCLPNQWYTAWPIKINLFRFYDVFGFSHLFQTMHVPMQSEVFTARCTLVQSAVLRLHVVCLSVCL